MQKNVYNDGATHNVYFHKNCPDGTVAAWCAREKLGSSANYIAIDWDNVQEDIAEQNKGMHVVVVDYAFPPIILRAIREQALSVVQLDHHASSVEMYKNQECPGCNITFDMHQSGAGLAWSHFFPNVEKPHMVKYVEDADLWRWSLPSSRGYSRNLGTAPLTFERLDEMYQWTPEQVQNFMNEGEKLQAQYDMLCKTFADIARPLNLDGIQGHHVSASRALSSDVGEMIYNENKSFACVWYVENETTIKIGLRSHKTLDVKSIAQRFGGGGHPNASAFRLPIERLPELVSGKLWSAEYTKAMLAQEGLKKLESYDRD